MEYIVIHFLLGTNGIDFELYELGFFLVRGKMVPLVFLKNLGPIEEVEP